MVSRDAKVVFEILVRENTDMLMVYLRSVVWDQVAAEDLFQETMLVAWRKLDDFDRERPFGPWLRGIAGRLVMAYYRKVKRSALVCDEAVLVSLESQMDHMGTRSGDTFGERVEVLESCVAKLPQRLKEAIQLRYLEDTKSGEVASQLGISGEALKKRLQRARAAIADCLKLQGVFKEGAL